MTLLEMANDPLRRSMSEVDESDVGHCLGNVFLWFRPFSATPKEMTTAVAAIAQDEIWIQLPPQNWSTQG